jgi:hypothetical protein
MKKSIPFLTLTLAPAAMLLLTSCSTSSPPPGQTTTTTSFEAGVPGGVMVQTHKLRATVTAIDTANRKVTLVTPDHQSTTVKCGPEVINFDQIQVGDQLRVKITEEIAVAMATPGTPADNTADAVVVLAPKGAKPGGIAAGTVQTTAKVSAINLKKHKATLQLPDGTSKTFAVRPDVDLTQRHVGEEVLIRITEALAISVEKP